ncbi:MAG TPA: alpha/beta hydrolase, partial [Gemmatimonadales bacterium]|nr:alpha/beta hydrolase [Gemmatimonadales bacterium]
MGDRRIALTVIALLRLGAGAALFAQASGDAAAAAGTSKHRVAMVTHNGVRVPYLDWGGTGPGIVFIAGMGNSAHIFDDFAPRFVDRSHVLAVTRTGYGESDRPERDGYDLLSRVEHIREALDAVKIQKAVLVGHSLGGDEITAFAATYPSRTAALVYLDAAIDHAAALRTLGALGSSLPSPPDPTALERSSASSFRQYLRRITSVD